MFDGLDPEEERDEQAAHYDQVTDIDEQVDQELHLSGCHIAQETPELLAQIKAAVKSTLEKYYEQDGKQDLQREDAEDGLGGLSLLEADGAEAEGKDGHAPRQEH